MKRLLSFLLLITVLQTAAQNSDRIGYYYQGKKLSFLLNYTRFSFQLAPGESINTRRVELSRQLQVGDSALQIQDKAGRVTVTLTKGVGIERAKTILASLRQQSYIRYVHPCFTSAYGKDMSWSDELVVKLKPGTGRTVLDKMLLQYHCSLVREYPFAKDIYVLAAGPANQFDAIAVANKLFETGLFLYAEPDLSLNDGLFTDPNDPLFGYQWAQKNIGSPIQYNGTAGIDMKVQQAWGISTGAGITVAVIDEGVDTGHADLKANLLQGFNCLTLTANPGDGRPLGPARGHGTCCAGIVAAIANNSVGVAGVAPDAKLIPINLAAANGFFTSDANIAAGFDYAWQHGADVISNSWGGGSPSSTIDDAIFRATHFGRGGKGSVVLFASGNNNAGLSYPAVNPDVIAVGGVNMCGMRKSPASVVCDGESWGASYGSGLDVVAPCVKIATTDISGTGGYNTGAGAAGDYMLKFNGTSSATPNAAGVVALVLGANNNLTVTQLRNVLEGSCYKLPAYSYGRVPDQPNGTWNNETGYGLVDAYNAILTAQSGIYCNVQIKANGALRLCPGGTVGIDVINPVAGTSYQWRKDGINLSTGNAMVANVSGSYDVVATAANGCVAQSAAVLVTVLNNTPPLIADAGVDTLLCLGQKVKLGGYAPAMNGAPWLSDKRVYGMDWQGNSFVRFSLTNPLQLDTIAQNMVSNPDWIAGKFFAGGDFTPYGYYAITEGGNQVFKIDTSNGAQQLIGAAIAPTGYNWSGLAWDPVGRDLYALASASSGSKLYLVDPFTVSLSFVTDVSIGRTEWLAISNKGTLYTMSDNNFIYRINTSTGAATALPKSVGMDVNYEQDADFDPVTDSLYLSTIIQFQGVVGELRTADTLVGSTTLIGTIGGLSEIDATAIAGPGYLYNWSPAAGLSSTDVAIPVAQPAVTTTYTLRVTDMCGNTATDQVTVRVSTPPPAVISAVRDSICVGESVTLKTASGIGYSYQWFANGNAIAGATDSVYNATAGGSYTVHIINGACDSISAPFVVKTCSLLLNDNTPVSLCSTWMYDSGGPAAAYGNNESFTKTVSAGAAGNLLRLSFQSFVTEAGADSLQVFDGADTSAPLLATLSGTPALPLNLTAKSGQLTFKFTSNGSNALAGWKASIQCYAPSVYQTRKSGDFTDTAVWLVKTGSGFVPALYAPQQFDDSIIVMPGNTILINAPLSIDQLLIRQGGTLSISAPLQLNDGAGTDLEADGALQLLAGGTIAGNGNIIATGDIDNSASITARIDVPVDISGTSLQTIKLGAPLQRINIFNPAISFQLARTLNVDTLVMNSTAGLSRFSANAPGTLFSVNRYLSLLNGRLQSGNNAIIDLTPGIQINGSGKYSFIEGPLRRSTSNAGLTSLLYPVGRNGYRPVTLDITHGSAGLSAYLVEVFDTIPPARNLPATLNAVSSQAYTSVTNLGSQPVLSAVIHMGYDSADLVTDTSQLHIAQDDLSGNWIDLGGVNSAYRVSSANNFTSFGNFALANAVGGTNAFAMRWISAVAQVQNKQVRVSWSVGNEFNIARYELQRSSDGVLFNETIATVAPLAGNAVSKNYQAWDYLPLKTAGYYRVKQIANDGRIGFSPVMTVPAVAAGDWLLWPSPASNYTAVQAREPIQQLRVYNNVGQLVYEAAPGVNSWMIPLAALRAGVYHVKLNTASETKEISFIKQ
ncbi:MAG: S8 family serine peptidase [Bacteroidota bacterium]|nr:S8 family serine peptidase [Bacteroidota bacterium]